MTDIHKRLLLAGATIALTTGFAPSLLAADATTEELTEVVVTAEGVREVNLQKVSTSIQVKDGADLLKQGKKRIDDIMQGTVGIQAQDSQVGVTFFVRGVDSSGGMGAVVAVPVIVDGVVQARSESVRGGTLDMARAEIMRGPQSSTLGVNALAGAVSLVSNRPVFEYAASGTLTLGSYGLRSTEAVLNVPLADNQALRIAYSSEKRRGYISSGAGDSDLTNVRARYRVQPNENVDVVATLSHQNIGGNGVQQGVLLARGRWVPYSTANFPALTFTGCAPNGPVTTMGCPATFVVVNDGVDFRQRANAWNDGYPARSFPINAFRDTNINTASVELNWTTGIGTVTFIPAVQQARFRSQEPPRGTSYMAEDQKQRQTTIDLRLSGNPGGRFDWQVGAYSSTSRTTNGIFKSIDYPGGMGCAPTGGLCYSFGLTPFFERKAANVFATGEFSLSDTFRLIGSLRHNDDSASVNALSLPATVNGGVIGGTDAGANPALVAQAINNRGSRSWKETTYRGGIEWDFLPGHMLYAVYNTGYSPGALDGMNLAGTVESTLEQTTVGLKSQFFDNRVQFNVEAFNTTFHNRLFEGTASTFINGATSATCFQAGPPPPPGTLITVINGAVGQCASVAQNAATVPELISKGVDLDLTWLMSANDRLTLTGEILDAGYDAAPVLGTITAANITDAFLLGPGVSGGATVTAAQRTALAAGLRDLLNGIVGAQLQRHAGLSAHFHAQ
jgi:iron complex outermembrane recepter protein